MTGIHVVPDRQQYIGLRQVHTLYRIDSSMIGTHQLHLANADMIPGVVPDRQQYDRHSPITSCNPASALTIHPRKIQALYCNNFTKSNNHDTGSYDTLY